MICPSCDTLNREDAKFCKKCGHPFRTADAVMSEAADVSQAPIPVQENMNTEEDISSAPTQIISPQQMMAFHASRWQKDLELEHAEAQTQEATVESQAAGDTADVPGQQPAYSPIPAPVQNEPSQNAGDILSPSAGAPGGNEPMAAPPSPVADAEPVSIPPPPPMVEAVVPGGETPGAAKPETTAKGDKVESDLAVASPAAPPEEDSPVEAGLATAMAADTAANTPPKEGDDGVTLTPSDQPEQPKEAAPTSDFPVLAAGTTVIGRYEVTKILSEDQQEHSYEVTDHQGYQHCWNCHSEQNSEGDEFCIDCGAKLLDASYKMNEYPATESQDTDASVLHGAIVNTFVDQGKTYVIEQPQTSENAFPNGVHLIAGSDSDAGDVRRSEPNEDSTLVLMLQRIHESQATPSGVFIIADGLGGHENGQVASRMTINIIAERMVRELLAAPLATEKAGESEETGEAANKLDEDALVALLQSAVEDANAAICQVNQRDKTDMGSTITGFMVVGDYAYILNVGDSRTYMVRGEQIYQLTTDHSLVGQLVAGGLIQPDDIYTHPQRSQIFRSLGDKLNVQIDIFKQQLHPGDILLSCSDGLWEMVRNPQIESILNNAPDPQVACTQLIEAANSNGGEDNVSAVVVFVH